MWGQSAHVSQQRPGAPELGPPAAPFRTTVHAGTVAAQPNETRLRRTGSVATLPVRPPAPLPRWHLTLGVVVCPLISGLFFGAIAAVLVLDSGIGRALEVGALAAGIMFTTNALALCIVTSATHSEPTPAIASVTPETSGSRAC
jgi:hypothetical protein